MGQDFVVLEVAVRSVDDTDAARVSAELARELEDAGAESVRPQRRDGVAEPGTKGAFECGKLLVEVVGTGLPPIIGALAGWLARRPAEKVHLKWREGDREVELECSDSTLAGSRIDELVARLQRLIGRDSASTS